MYVRKIKSFVHTLCRSHNIFRIAGIRIKRNKGTHTSDLKLRINLMTFFHNDRTCNQLMMRRLIHCLFLVFIFRKTNARICPSENIGRRITLIIDFIKRHPIFNFTFIPLHNCHCIVYKEINHLTIDPSAIFFCQMIRHLKVA